MLGDKGLGFGHWWGCSVLGRAGFGLEQGVGFGHGLGLGSGLGLSHGLGHGLGYARA